MSTKLYRLVAVFAISFVGSLNGFAQQINATDTIRVKLYPQGTATKNGLEDKKETYD